MRFYLGAAYFFGDVYPKKDSIDTPKTPQPEPEPENLSPAEKTILVIGPTAIPPDEKTNYALDFISGFAHFLAFVILGMTIDVHTKPLSWFPVVVTFILLYDGLWWAFSIPYKRTRKIIKWWALINAINFGASLLIFFALLLAKQGPLIAELWAYSLVLAVSAYDIGSMMGGRPYFQRLREQLTE